MYHDASRGAPRRTTCRTSSCSAPSWWSRRSPTPTTRDAARLGPGVAARRAPGSTSARAPSTARATGGRHLTLHRDERSIPALLMAGAASCRWPATPTTRRRHEPGRARAAARSRRRRGPRARRGRRHRHHRCGHPDLAHGPHLGRRRRRADHRRGVGPAGGAGPAELDGHVPGRRRAGLGERHRRWRRRRDRAHGPRLAGDGRGRPDRHRTPPDRPRHPQVRQPPTGAAACTPCSTRRSGTTS